jgi:selenide, water dikinase
MNTRKPSDFDPTSIGLPADFRLTNYATLKGCGCKVPQAKLLEYLKNITGNDFKPNETPGMDSSVVATRFPGIFMVSTTDFFTCSVEDPYLQGRLAAANTLSDLYSMAVTEVDTMLMLLTVSLEMPTEAADIVTTLMIKGFNDCAKEAGTNVTGGQTVKNPWPVLGGVAMSLCREDEMIRPSNASPGDVLVLTKPIGTQVAVNIWQWRDNKDKFSPVAEAVGGLSGAADAYDTACRSMGTLNLTGARLMHKYKARAATDVTGFGLLGHARNMAHHSAQAVDLEIDVLPVIKNMVAADDALQGKFKLRQGLSAETSGGLLVVLSADVADAFIQEISGSSPVPTAWKVGKVFPGSGSATISPTAEIIEVLW